MLQAAKIPFLSSINNFYNVYIVISHRVSPYIQGLLLVYTAGYELEVLSVISSTFIPIYIPDMNVFLKVNLKNCDSFNL